MAKHSMLLPLSFLLPSHLMTTLGSMETQRFIHCFHNNAGPISAAIYPSNNSSYSFVLQSHICNLLFNSSKIQKPFLIVTALHESHVQASVICARQHGLVMKIRSGGHDFEGLSYVSHGTPFFILDMFNLRSVDVNLEEGTAWVEAGATLGDLYYGVSQKSKIHGFPAGDCPTVGVGGLFSAGGKGFLMRKYGLSIDYVIDAKMVDVNGKLLDRKSMGKDLFWAIRGGRGGSFGVIIAYKIKLARFPETVTIFRVERTSEQHLIDILYKWQVVSPMLDEDLFLRVDIDVKNSIQNGSRKMAGGAFKCLFLGESAKLLSTMNESFPELALQKFDCIETTWINSVQFFANFSIKSPSNVLLDRTPLILNKFKGKSDYVKNAIPKTALEGMLKKMVELESVVVKLYPYGGKVSEIPENETPFPHRGGNLLQIHYTVHWDEEGNEAAKYYTNKVRAVYECMTPFMSKNPREAYFGYRDLDLGINTHNSDIEGKVYGVKYFKGNFNRLVKVKTMVDPYNFFTCEQGIPVFPYRRNNYSDE